MNPLFHECYEVPTKNLLGFYYPGRVTPIDSICNANFLGNFWMCQLIVDAVTFKCAEAAYQALKYPLEIRSQFSNCDGSEAFRLSREIKCHMYTPQEAWINMMYVVEQKFQNLELANKLLETGDAFLLEHNNVIGRDARWSDNGDGTGSNWLGLQLMIVRDSIREARLRRFSIVLEPLPWTAWVSKHLDPDTGIFFYGMEAVWHEMVVEASKTIVTKIASMHKTRFNPNPRINNQVVEMCKYTICNKPRRLPYQFCSKLCGDAFYTRCMSALN